MLATLTFDFQIIIFFDIRDTFPVGYSLGGAQIARRNLMAKEIPDLVAVARTGTGKGAARQARRNGMVPGVVYGGGVDPPTYSGTIQ